MGERDQPAIPVAVMHVQRNDTELTQLRQPSLWTFLHFCKTRGIHEQHIAIRRCNLREHLEILDAHVGAFFHSTGRRVQRTTHRIECFVILDIERQRYSVLGCKLHHFAEMGDMRRKIATGRVGDSASSPTRTHHAVMVEYGFAIGSEPHVGLQTRCSKFERQSKRSKCVLLLMGTCTTVCKQPRSGQE